MSGIDYSKWDNLECSDSDDAESMNDNPTEVIEFETEGVKKLRSSELLNLSKNSTLDSTSAQNAKFLSKAKDFKKKEQCKVEETSDNFFFEPQTEDIEYQERKLRGLISQMGQEELEDRDLDEDLLVDAFRLLRQRQAEHAAAKTETPVQTDILSVPASASSSREKVDSAVDMGLGSKSEASTFASHQPFKPLHNHPDSQPTTTTTTTTTTIASSKLDQVEHPQHKALLQLRSMIRNGNAFGPSTPATNGNSLEKPMEIHTRYLWSQDRERVTLNVEVPAGTKSKDIQISLEKGTLEIWLRGSLIFHEKIAYAVTTPDDTSSQSTSSRFQDSSEAILQRLESFVEEGASSLGTALPQDMTMSLDTVWTLHDMPGDMKSASPVRRIEIELGKMAPPGLTIWWKRFFQSEPEIDVSKIEDRRVGGLVQPILGSSEKKMFESPLDEGTLSQDIDQVDAAQVPKNDTLSNRTMAPLTDDELLRVPLQQVQHQVGVPDFFSYDHISRERERIEEGLKVKHETLSPQEWNQKFVKGNDAMD